MKRRDFLVRSALVAAGAGLAADPRRLAALRFTGPVRRDEELRALMMLALDAARSAGAEYADVRIARNRSQTLATREHRVTGVSDDETFGLGVRVLAGGSWGFVASYDLRPDEVVRVARQAVSQGRANARARRAPVELAPVEVYPDVTWRSPIRVDPFEVSLEEKVELLMAANAAALRTRGARFVNSSLAFLREEKFFASTVGTLSTQTLYRTAPLLTVTAVSDDNSDFQTRASTDVSPRGLGYEYVLDSRLVENAPRWAEDAVRKLSARSVEPGQYDLVLLPSHLWLTIHESIAHPTELDRIMGFEANLAGTSFISPSDLGTLRFGRPFMNVQAERSAIGGLSTVGYDDEGVRPREYLIVEEGVLSDLQTTRQEAPWLAEWYASRGEPVRSGGNSYAQSWADVQIQRMPNINLLPNPERDVPLEELIDGVQRGIMIDGDGSFSIDQQRYNAQFGGQVFHEIRNGRIEGELRDVAYQFRTPEFWNSMDLIGGQSSYFMGGSAGDGKGQPTQRNAVSHGCVPARFRQVTVINSSGSA
jgi:TldD protein